MSDTPRHLKRREFTLAATAAIGAATLWSPAVHAQAAPSFKPEKGAKLRVLRWSRFVQGDIDAYMANVKKFTEKTGIEVRVDNEGWEDVRPKAAVAANTGSGPDIILSTNDDANLYPEKLLDVTDLAEYLGKKYGGWYPAVEAYLRPDGKKWLGLGLGAAGAHHGQCSVHAGGLHVADDDGGAFLGELQRRGQADALGGAGDDGNLVFQSHSVKNSSTKGRW